MTVDLRGRLTLTVPEAGQLCGLGRDASYAAAERGELPSVKVGRRLLVPTHRLLDEVLGMPAALVAQALGLSPPPEAGEAAPATGATTAYDHSDAISEGAPRPHDANTPTQPSNLRAVNA